MLKARLSNYFWSKNMLGLLPETALLGIKLGFSVVEYKLKSANNESAQNVCPVI